MDTDAVSADVCSRFEVSTAFGTRDRRVSLLSRALSEKEIAFLTGLGQGATFLLCAAAS